MAWPHERTPWRPFLDQACQTVAQVIAAVSHHARVLLVTEQEAHARSYLQATSVVMERVVFIPLASNDTWARDFGPISVFEEGRPLLLDFQFNGWGGKYPFTLDNALSARLRDHGVFGETPLRTLPLVLEGGSLESDGAGTLLTTSSCNLNPNRNSPPEPARMEQAFREHLGISRVLWLRHGHLAGDDTDGHVDMLARFADRATILYQSCPCPGDEHHASLSAMAEDLRAFRTDGGAPYRLIPLPWPEARYDQAGNRMPASYANFLILNEAVLLPVYGVPQDAEAQAVVAAAFPGRQVEAIPCSALIRQHGSLHCITMQIPKGVLP